MNQLTGDITITDTKWIKQEGDKMTGEGSGLVEVKKEVPDVLPPNPLRQNILTVITVPSELATTHVKSEEKSPDISSPKRKDKGKGKAKEVEVKVESPRSSTSSYGDPSWGWNWSRAPAVTTPVAGLLPMAAQDAAELYDVPVVKVESPGTAPEPVNPLEDIPVVVKRIRDAPDELVASSGSGDNKRARTGAPMNAVVAGASRKAYKETRDQYNVNITARNKYYDTVDRTRRKSDQSSSVSLPSGIELGGEPIDGGAPSGSGFMYEHLAMEDLRRAPRTAEKRKATRTPKDQRYNKSRKITDAPIPELPARARRQRNAVPPRTIQTRSQTRAARENQARAPAGNFIGVEVPPRTIQTRAEWENRPRRPRGTLIGVEVPPRPRPYEVVAMRPRGNFIGVDIPPLSEVQREPVAGRRRRNRR